MSDVIATGEIVSLFLMYRYRFVTLPVETTSTSCFLQANVVVASSTRKYCASGPGSSKADVGTFGHHCRYRCDIVLCFAPANYLLVGQTHKCTFKSTETNIVFHGLVSFSMVCLKALKIFHVLCIYIYCNIAEVNPFERCQIWRTNPTKNCIDVHL